MQRLKLSPRVFAAAAIALSTSMFAVAQNEIVLHSFSSSGRPSGGVIPDSSGNLYGTAWTGGGSFRFGTVFELTPTASGWEEKLLQTFDRPAVGMNPEAGLIFDKVGNLYGTTSFGGPGPNAWGTVFELSPQTDGSWSEKILHVFGSGSDGMQPTGSLVFDSSGNLYGTTEGGGTYGLGTVFELSPTPNSVWAEKVLHSFNYSPDGNTPSGNLILDKAGNLYGTAPLGGVYGAGTVFELMRAAGGNWIEKTLHSFGLGQDGAEVGTSVTLDTAGDLYGVTTLGGTGFGGTVFELSPTNSGTWNEEILHDFDYRGPSPNSPANGVVFDSFGNLYTVTGGGAFGAGAVVELRNVGSGTWLVDVLYNFETSGDGAGPFCDLIFDGTANIYGTTLAGGTYNNGTVFQIVR